MTTIKLASGVLAIPMLSLTLALAAAEVGGTPTDPAPSVAKAGQNSESGNRGDETVGLGGSVYRARRDLREPSDPPIVERSPLRDETVGSSIDRAPRDLREPFDE